MPWKQIVDPFNNLSLSAVIAVVPVLFIFWALIIKKLKGYQASLCASVIAMLIAIAVYGMPVKLAVLSTLNGALYGLFPICWIVITAVFLFNITVQSGKFEIIKHFMGSVTSDRRLQALLIAFSFGSFLEGTAGFGAPVAITAAMLVGLGFNPLYASGICLIANTSPVAFGAIGIPISVASQVTGIPEMAISQMVGRTLPVLSLMLPFYLVLLMCGFKKTMEVLPAILVSGFSFAFLQWFSSNFIGPALPDVIAGVGSIVTLMIFLRYWKPKHIWRFSRDASANEKDAQKYNPGSIIIAWSPFILLVILIIAWGMKPVKQLFNSFALLKFEIPGLHNMISDRSDKLLPHVFTFNYLSASGTAILMAGLISIPLIGITYKTGARIFLQTLNQLKYPIITIASVLGFAYIANDSGITITLADALAKTGALFPFFAPILGWLGVFITGSDTSSNALFGNLQASTATSIGIDPVVTVSANVCGGVVGKMISPQSIAIAAAGGGLIGKESDLFRFTVKHSFFFLIIICLIVSGQSYLFKWLIPAYQKLASTAGQSDTAFSKGYLYLTIFAGIIAIFVATVLILKRKKVVD